MKAPATSPEVIDRSAEHDLVEFGIETVERFIARVLRRARLAALAVGEPSEARAILTLAHLFADEIASADARFDRRAFVAAVTEDVS